VSEGGTLQSHLLAVVFAIGNIREASHVKECKENHLKCLDESSKPGIDVFCVHILCVLDNVEGMQSAEERALPEHEKNDCLDREELEKWLVLLDPVRDGEVELDQAEHGD
jgi:hypothetical protein